MGVRFAGQGFGSPQDVEVSGNVTVTEMTYEEREAKINEYISIRMEGATLEPDSRTKTRKPRNYRLEDGNGARGCIAAPKGQCALDG